MKNLKLLQLLESVLGKGKPTSGNNIAFFSPFTSHYKPKLEIDINTDNDGRNPWHCWISDKKGRSIHSLFKQLNLSKDKFEKLGKIIERSKYRNNSNDKKQIEETIQLPEDYKPLWLERKTPDYRNAIYYLQKRGINIFDIIRYRIGYSESGPYSGKIIIPSYDSTGQLNYFVSRAFYESDPYKHKNPKISKDIIGFDMLINWNEPIILCEGAFDAITIKRNAIPLFGKMINPKLRIKIIEEGVKEIYICLDQDAIHNAKHIAQTFLREGIKVYLVKLDKEDPNELGYKKITEKVQDTYQFSFEELMTMEINSLWK
jgi:DNA primase